MAADLARLAWEWRTSGATRLDEICVVSHWLATGSGEQQGVASMNLKHLIEISHAIAKEKGWWPSFTPAARAALESLAERKPVEVPTPERGIPELLCLVHSEVSEALEAWREGSGFGVDFDANGKPVGLASELADVVIRVADMCGYFGIDLERAVLAKLEYNRTRPHRHGGKRA
jgi:NTP pyrophosphatase (non-canonical NTP hydrolase)